MGPTWEAGVLSSSLISTLNAVIRDLVLLPTLVVFISYSLFKYLRNQTLLPNRDPDQILPSSTSQKHLDKVSCNQAGMELCRRAFALNVEAPEFYFLCH